MFKLMNKQRNKKGFTLIELIVVIAILGILAMIAIPRFAGMSDRAQLQANISTATTILNAAEVAYVEGLAGITDPPTTDELVTANYLRAGAYTGYRINRIADGIYTVDYPNVAGEAYIGGTVGAAH